MKKYYLLSLLALIPFAQAEQTISNLYTETTVDGVTIPDLADASTWKVGSLEGDTFTGSVSSTETTINNLNISYTVPFEDNGSGANSYNSKKAFYVGSDIVANDINLYVDLADKVWVSNALSASSGTYKITASNLTLTAKSTTYNPWYFFTDLELDLSGDFTVKIAEGSKNKIVRFGTGAKKWNIDGKVYYDNVSSAEFYIQNYDTTISGGIHFKELSSKSDIIIKGASWKEANVSLGGLSSTKLVTLGVESAGSVVNLFFTNSEAFDATTSYVQRIEDVSTITTNITMNAASVNGKQTLRFNTVADFKPVQVNLSNNNLGEINVFNGTLEIGMYEGMCANALYVYGENATFSATALATGNIGNAYFTNAEFGKGTIVFDYSIDEGNDLIIISDNFALANTDNVKFVLQSENDIKSWLEEGETIDAFTIISFDSTDLTADDIANIKVDAGEGLDAILSAIEENGNIIGIQANITLASVPEPATVAGILGVLALAFATYRRRK